MDEKETDRKIVARGKELFRIMEGRKPSLFDESRWVGMMMAWSFRHGDIRTGMLRFVDVFPSLVTPRLLAEHVKGYFGKDVSSMPAPLRISVRAASHGGRFSAAILSAIVRIGIQKMGRQFIVGDTIARTLRGLAAVRRSGCAFSVDILGEAVLSEHEAVLYENRYQDLLTTLRRAEASWKPIEGQGTSLDWGYAPKIALSIKPSALYSQAKPQDFDGSVEAILRRLKPFYEKVIEAGAFLTIDMESYRLKDMTIEVFRRLRRDYASYPYLSIVLQAYLKETERDLESLLEWSKSLGLPIAVRLVKGAYWDHEVMRAKQNGWDIPVYTGKAETDAAFERHARTILQNHEIAYLGCASHNIRSIAAAMETADRLGVPRDRYEFQVLYGMAEPVREALLKTAGRVRLYCPSGEIVPGVAYLVRRLLENTANQSFLRLMFGEKAEVGELLRDPRSIGSKGRKEASDAMESERPHDGESPVAAPFRNEPSTEFASQKDRELFARALVSVRNKLGAACPLYINGKDRITPDTLPSLNPADSREVIAHVCQGGNEEAEEAIGAAVAAFGGWRDMPYEERAAFLLRAASSFRTRKFELAAWQVLEIGKQWDQAYGDVSEAIDFMEYYAREMIRFGAPRRLPSPPGELNHSFYEPRGVAVVIAPWNFPLAISCGMVSAAVVTGNTVVYKPSPLTPVTGRLLVEAFQEAGLPPGVFNFIPGRAEVIASCLTDHPAVRTIAFTGSTNTGLGIIERAAILRPGQEGVKKVICEMGGKNGIIIDEDADLDEAVPAIIHSAFGFQGQKCSSCSRVIALASVYDTLVERLIGAARSLRIGPAENPACFMGPVADELSCARIMDYIKIAEKEGTILYSGRVPAGGNYVPLTIVGDIHPGHTIAQEEIFGPVLALMKVKTFEKALEWANSARFALTGGVFSRDPAHLEEARLRFKVGNLYLNRSITGALVERQPFGGLKLSGLGTKAGGPDYLLHFMDPRVVTENTARRGFSPDIS
ncbi:MAG TPA: proline dehydrogenase family protein [Syntrophorhabdaceae bacterium]|jgi:RHH-type proline utilization regulon transcriptional repressor/proline dehydrogenase/delta 1-pyrroline-5-carboxylate dehydrogenase